MLNVSSGQHVVEPSAKVSPFPGSGGIDLAIEGFRQARFEVDGVVPGPCGRKSTRLLFGEDPCVLLVFSGYFYWFRVLSCFRGKVGGYSPSMSALLFQLSEYCQFIDMRQLWGGGGDVPPRHHSCDHRSESPLPPIERSHYDGEVRGVDDTVPPVKLGFKHASQGYPRIRSSFPRSVTRKHIFSSFCPMCTLRSTKLVSCPVQLVVLLMFQIFSWSVERLCAQSQSSEKFGVNEIVCRPGVY
jgi:hypothetical protein